MVNKLRNSGAGIGDQVCGLYACQALKNQHPDVKLEYYSKHPDWFKDVLDIEIRPYKEFVSAPVAKTDLYLDSTFNEYRTKGDLSRKAIYAQRTGAANLKPTPPKLKRSYERVGRSNILLVPFAAWKEREWPLKKWLELERLLLASGLRIRVLAQSERMAELEKFISPKLVDCEPSIVIDSLLDSSCVVSNDSGMAHVAGLYGVPTVAILSSEFSSHHLFSQTNVVGVTNSHSRSLYSQPKNWLWGSRRDNHGLSGISVFAVQGAVNQVLTNINGSVHHSGSNGQLPTQTENVVLPKNGGPKVFDSVGRPNYLRKNKVFTSLALGNRLEIEKANASKTKLPGALYVSNVHINEFS